MIDCERLCGQAAGYGIDLSRTMLQKLDEYAEMLVAWNQKINLTAITKPTEIEEKHFLDSLLFAAQPQVRGKVADVGSGAGFPGIVTQIYKENAVAVTLLEPTGKRVNFLKAVVEALRLPCQVVKERAEEAGRKEWREKYDVVTARAVASLGVLCEYCLPLAKPGGWFLAMKGADLSELAAAGTAMDKLGGTYRETRSFHLPGGSARSLVLIEKTGQTPAAYPRNGGVIAKRPL